LLIAGERDLRVEGKRQAPRGKKVAMVVPLGKKAGAGNFEGGRTLSRDKE